MSGVADYPINFPFGATTSPYSKANPHLGDDRAAPSDTDVVVAGTVIGRVGNTGQATGPHAHIAKWIPGNLPGGIYVQAYNATYFNPADALSTGGVVTQLSRVDSGDAGKFVRWQGDDGFTREVFHLSEVLVNEGQSVGQKGDDMTNDDTLPRLWVSFMDLPLNDPGYQGFHDYWLGRREADCIQWLMDTPRHIDIIEKARKYTDPGATQKTLDAIKRLVNQG